jgi:probable HAF family extracellular repeat protein
VMHDIGTLGGPDALMNNMNARGQIAGDSYTNDTPNTTGIGGFCPATGTPTTDPFLWTDGHMRDLGTLGGTASQTFWLNDRGEVVGTDYLAGNQACGPFLWNGRQLIDLGTFGGNEGAAFDINDAGVVVGWSLLPGDSTAHAFEWHNGVMTDLTGSSSPDCTIAGSVNNGGVVVGQSCGQDQTDALIWIDGHQYDLNALVPQTDAHLTDAQGINDQGQIVALGQLPNGNQHIFLLTPDGRPLQASIATLRTGSTPHVGHGSLRLWLGRAVRTSRSQWWQLMRASRLGA